MQSKNSLISVEILTQVNREGFTFKVKVAVPLALLVLIISAVADSWFHNRQLTLRFNAGSPGSGLPAVFCLWLFGMTVSVTVFCGIKEISFRAGR